jgi:hypothetical protein
LLGCWHASDWWSGASKFKPLKTAKSTHSSQRLRKLVLFRLSTWVSCWSRSGQKERTHFK